jgi:GTPase SAR1 family protein
MGTVGSTLSRTYHGYMSRNERRVLLLGLDGAGKTSECSEKNREESPSRAAQIILEHP